MTEAKFINKAGKGRYDSIKDLEQVIRYITRKRKNEAQEADLITWGALGAAEYGGIEEVIRDFKIVQIAYSKPRRISRYIDHEIYSFSQDEQDSIRECGADIDKIARIMAYDFYEEGTQVVYAVHCKDEGIGRMHVHFAINTVNYRTGKKRREMMTDTNCRKKRFQNIVKSELFRNRLNYDQNDWEH